MVDLICFTVFTAAMDFFDRVDDPLDNNAGHACNGGVEDMKEGEGINDSRDIWLGSRVAFHRDMADEPTILRGFIESLPEDVVAGNIFNVKLDDGWGHYEFNRKDILGKWITYEHLQCDCVVDLIIVLKMPWP